MKLLGRLTRLAFLILTIQVLVSGGVQAADNLERLSGHPYLLYTNANIDRLKERVQMPHLNLHRTPVDRAGAVDAVVAVVELMPCYLPTG